MRQVYCYISVLVVISLQIQFYILLWQEICRGYHGILMQNSACEDSEVSRSRLPIKLQLRNLPLMKQCRILHENLDKFFAEAINKRLKFDNFKGYGTKNKKKQITSHPQQQHRQQHRQHHRQQHRQQQHQLRTSEM